MLPDGGALQYRSPGDCRDISSMSDFASCCDRLFPPDRNTMYLAPLLANHRREPRSAAMGWVIIVRVKR